MSLVNTSREDASDLALKQHDVLFVSYFAIDPDGNLKIKDHNFQIPIYSVLE